MKLEDFSDFPGGVGWSSGGDSCSERRQRENLKNPLTSRVFRVVGASAAWETQKNYLQPLANRLGSIGAIGKAPDRILDFRASINIYLHIRDFLFLEAAGHFGARYLDDQRSDFLIFFFNLK